MADENSRSNEGNNPQGEPQASPGEAILNTTASHPEEASPREPEGEHEQSNAIQSTWQKIKKISPEGWQALSSLALVFITAILAYYAVAQWRAMVGQLNAMKETIAEIKRQTDAAEKTAKAAIDSVGIAQEALVEARRNFRQDQRPYVGIAESDRRSALQPMRANTGEIMWTWHYTNYGRSPAHRILITFSMDIAGKREMPIKLMDEGTPLPPRDIEYSTAISRSKVSAKEFDRLMKETDDGIILRGQISYVDTYGEKYETGFCFQHLATGARMLCEKGNYMK